MNMSESWIQWLVAGGASSVILVAGGRLTELGPWYRALKKPTWQPADWVFPVAWTTIYALVTWAAVVVWDHDLGATNGALLISAFLLNGMLNIAWSLIFFRMRRPDWALLEVVPLWLSTFLLMVAFYAVVPFAGWLLLPYLLWVSVAAVLNLSIVRLNGSIASWSTSPASLTG
jgi:tryptophan-rich sensory protein